MHKRQYSMKWKVIQILLICWLIPFLFMIGVMGVYIGTNHSDMIALNYKEQMSFNMKHCAERLDQAVQDSRLASYDGEILRVKKEYHENKISSDAAYKQHLDYLQKKYQSNPLISAAILWFGEDSDMKSSFVYHDKYNGSYQMVRSYWDYDHKSIAEFADTLETRIGFMVRGNKLYLVRNLMDNRYTVQGVLVLLLNKQYCFESILDYPTQEISGIRINDEEPLFYNFQEEDVIRTIEKNPQKDYFWIKGRLYLQDCIKGDGYLLYARMKLKKNVNMYPFFGYQYVIGGMLFSLFLMLLLVLGVFKREVTEPLNRLSEGVTKIDSGNLGYQIEDSPGNYEFAFLTTTVNRMSTHLHEQFIRIYQEEIALREARIMALQSHINPHFMNNTLEIINWEARLGGNEKVSKMIGALSKLLDSALDRRKLPEVKLEEEMANVNAYLYIMKERLGEKLTIDDQITGDLLSCEVPRLVMQPLIENAIEHGVIPNKNGTITIRGKHIGDFLHIEILNDGSFTEEEKEKIDRLLKPDYNTSKESSGNLGIANVNQRLRILFGEPSGLMITEENGQICSRIIVPWNNNNRQI